MTENVLLIRRNALGEAHPHTVATVYGLALIDEVAGDFAGAEKRFQQCLKGYRECFGTDNHTDILHSLNGIGTSQVRQGKHEQAIRSFRRAFEVSLVLVGKDHSKSRLFLNNLMICFEARKKPEEVLEFYNHFESRISLQHEVLCKMVLARTLWQNNRLDEAIEIQTALCEQLEASQMPLSKKAEAYRRLKDYYVSNEQPAKAQEAWDRAMELSDIQ